MKLDRLSRSLDFLKINELIDGKGATLSFTDQHIETDTPAGKLMVQMLGAFAEFERETIRERVQSVSIRHVVTASSWVVRARTCLPIRRCRAC